METMKTLAILLACFVAGVKAHAQGTVQFANLGPGINAYVYAGNSGQLAAAGYMAQLLLVGTGGSLTAVGSPANFIGAAAPGYFSGGVVTVSQVAPGALGTFRVFAWNSVGGGTIYAAGLA